MTVKKYEFVGSFNEFGKTEIHAPSEGEAWKIFLGIDHGTGYGITDERDVQSITCLGSSYEFDGDLEDWREAVKLGECE